MRVLRAGIPIWVAVLALAIAVAASVIAVSITNDDDESAAPAVSASTENASSTPNSDTRDLEYAMLAKLRAGMTLDYFKYVLGTPVFATPGRNDSRFTQYLFRQRDFWLEAVADPAGTVELMAVTACDPDFHPRYDGVSGAFPRLSSIVLNETHMDQSGATPNTVRYFTSGATASSYYFDEYYLGNPGNYKTYFVGINDACPYTVTQEAAVALALQQYEQRPFDEGDPLISGLRASAVANTYGETGVFFDEAVLKEFGIGPDRILTRTAPPYTP